MKTLFIVAVLLFAGCALRAEKRVVPSIWDEQFARKSDIIEVLLRGRVKPGERIVVVAPHEVIRALSASESLANVTVESAEGVVSRKHGYFNRNGEKVDLLFTFSSLEALGGRRLIVHYGEHFMYDDEVLWEVELVKANGKWRIAHRKQLLVS